MPLEAALNAAGGLVAAELKGDFTAARATLDGAPDTPETQLAHGIIDVLAGYPQRGAKTLTVALPGLSGAQAELAVAMLRHARREAESTFPHGAGGSGRELRRRVTPDEDESEFTDSRAAWVATLLVRAPARRKEMATVAGLAGWLTDEQIQDALDSLVPEAEVGVWRGPLVLSGAHVYHAARHPEAARETLEIATAAYEESGDTVGAGVCRLTSGDWYAASLTSPLSWGLVLARGIDSSDVFAGDELIERTPPDLAAARAEYALAAPLLETAPRAQAALTLRLGYLAALERDPTAARDAAEEALAAYASAGDARGEHLAAAHAVLARIDGGELLAGDDLVASIAAWGNGDGSWAFALGLGFLLSRAGRHWLVRERDAERALAAHRLAEALYEALGAETEIWRTLADRAATYKWMGAADAAILAYDEALTRANADAGSVEDALQLLGIVGSQIPLTVQSQNRRRLEAAVKLGETLLERLGALTIPEALTERVAAAFVYTPGLLVTGKVNAHVLSSLEAERSGRSDHAKAYLDLALQAAAGTPTAESAMYAVLGRKDEARAAYLQHVRTRALPAEIPLTFVAELDLPFFVQFEAWPEAAERIAELDALDPGWTEKSLAPWNLLVDCGRVREALGDREAALALYERAIEAIEHRRGSVSADAQRVGQAIAWPFSLAALNRLDAAAAAVGDDERLRLRGRAFELAERGRARALLDMLAAGSSAALNEPARRWREAEARVALARRLAMQASGSPNTEAAFAHLLAEEEAFAAAERELADAFPGWREVVSPTAPPLTLEQVRAELPEDGLLLQYQLLSGRELLAFAVTRAGVVNAVHARDLDGLAAAMVSFAENCYDGGEWETSAQPVQDALIAPFAEQLARHPRLFVVPSGTVHRVPFAALRWNGGLLRDTHTLSTLPSASALKFLRPGGKLSGPVLALGDPAEMTYGPSGGKVEFLGAAAACAARAFGDRPLLGSQATEAALRERCPGAEIVLLGTHCTVELSPPRGFLLLAHGDGLELHEVMGLDLTSAELVVLAACETGVGAVTGGEEVMGFARALLGAGAQRAVLTLWKTPADSAPLLVHALVEHLRAGTPPAEALRCAQRALAAMSAEEARERYAALRAAGLAEGHGMPAQDPAPEDYSHPRHWAPYVLVGR